MNPSWLKKIYNIRRFISFRIEPRTCLAAPYYPDPIDKAEGGECCRAHYDANGFRHETMWCSHYCCQDRVRGHSPLYCCSDFFMRAERSDRLDFCSSWFSASSNL
uniref:Uncharacterized protein n=1 Tax=Magallana gigas TaxID=29159 RepID=K1QW28_MAGGI